jgi:hypothetical protein
MNDNKSSDDHWHGPDVRHTWYLLYWKLLFLPASGSSFSCLLSRLGLDSSLLSQSQSYFTTDKELAILPWCQAPIWGLAVFFPFLSFLISFRHLRFLDVGRPLWREVGSVVFNCCWALPAQSFSGLSPAELITISYCLNFCDSPQPW